MSDKLNSLNISSCYHEYNFMCHWNLLTYRTLSPTCTWNEMTVELSDTYSGLLCHFSLCGFANLVLFSSFCLSGNRIGLQCFYRTPCFQKMEGHRFIIPCRPVHLCSLITEEFGGYSWTRCPSLFLSPKRVTYSVRLRWFMVQKWLSLSYSRRSLGLEGLWTVIVVLRSEYWLCGCSWSPQ